MYSINIEQNDEVSVYDLFSSIEIIPLETDSNSLLTFLIGEPDKVIINHDKYYFFDKSRQQVCQWKPSEATAFKLALYVL